MAKAICVKNWTGVFEKSDLKKTQQWSWIAMPIRFDGRGWRRLTARKDFEQVFSGFVVICEVAGLMPTKGLLVDAQGVVVDADELSTKTGIRRATFDTAFEVLTDPEAKILWLEWVDVPDIRIAPDSSGSTGPTVQNSTEPNRTEQNIDCSEPGVPASEPPILQFPIVGRGAKTWAFTDSCLQELSSAFPSLDVLAESRKALGWTQANPGRRKTSRGMKKFLFGWMGRAQERGHGNGQAEEPPEERARRLARESVL